MEQAFKIPHAVAEAGAIEMATEAGAYQVEVGAIIDDDGPIASERMLEVEALFAAGFTVSDVVRLHPDFEPNLHRLGRIRRRVLENAHPPDKSATATSIRTAFHTGSSLPEVRARFPGCNALINRAYRQFLLARTDRVTGQLKPAKVEAVCEEETPDRKINNTAHGARERLRRDQLKIAVEGRLREMGRDPSDHPITRRAPPEALRPEPEKPYAFNGGLIGKPKPAASVLNEEPPTEARRERRRRQEVRKRSKSLDREEDF